MDPPGTGYPPMADRSLRLPRIPALTGLTGLGARAGTKGQTGQPARTFAQLWRDVIHRPANEEDFYGAGKWKT